MRLTEGVGVYPLATNMGTSVKMIEDFYGKKRVRDPKMATELTKLREAPTSRFLTPTLLRGIEGKHPDHHRASTQAVRLGTQKLQQCISPAQWPGFLQCFDLTQRSSGVARSVYATKVAPHMAPFLYRCPITSQTVQGWVADNGNLKDEAQAIRCIACSRLHLINTKTGRVIGESKE